MPSLRRESSRSMSSDPVVLATGGMNRGVSGGSATAGPYCASPVAAAAASASVAAVAAAAVSGGGDSLNSEAFAAQLQSLHSDEEVARFFAQMEARRHREDERARLDAERESFRMAMEMQAAEEEERERVRRASAAAEAEGLRVAIALQDEEEDRKLAARLVEEEEEESAAAAAAMASAGAAGAGSGADAASGAAVGGLTFDLAAMTAAAASAAGEEGVELVIPDADEDEGGGSSSSDEERALRMARAIQAEDERAMRIRDDVASLELARRLEREEEGRGQTGGGAGAGSDGAAGGRPIPSVLRRSDSSHSRSRSEPSPASPAALGLGPLPEPYLTRDDSAADLVRAALHHGPLQLRREEAWSRLGPRQREALGYVDCVAQALHEEAMPALRQRVQDLGFTLLDLETCLAYIRDDAPIIIHLKERTLDHLCRDPWYRSQFETGTSGGTLDRRRRQRWEDAMFGAAYADAPDDEHPKYGCLNITGDIMGVRGARGYGKLYLTLAPSVRHRTSFSNQDTGQQAGKSKLATNNWYGHVLAEYNDYELRTVFRVSGVSRLSGAPSTTFAQYKECQIHGTLSMATDVLALSVPGRWDAASDRLRRLVEEFRKISGCTILWQGDLLGD